ncbi:hypothetical protein E2P81_ATG01901 [Venturia nashicola]|uniref:Autophagy-related protein 28 n=1 Tax=Venturia nashicola TaxID=86259 RepID=A0A4Z1P7I2_9PEZI|nr:hypothetical protein E6O75_ATG01943 [Venturia nashicola]TLD35598.1 hypothetical protein E2P81_ATG01901 [Venturia nashicola]
MSLIDSWFPQRKHRRSNDSELPLWHEQHHLPTPFPPTSLAASMYQSALTHQDKSKANSPMSEHLNVLRRKEKVLHLTLQELLDEQSEGLLAGLGMKGRDEDEGARNTPSTTRIQRPSSLSPRPTQRRQRKPALGTTRRAIWKAILECAELKAEEDMLVKEELDENRFILEQLEGWAVKRDGLRKTIEEIEGEDSKTKAKSLKEEAVRLHEEILDLEAKLAQMKMRHRQILEEVDEMDNEGQSKLSSYKASLDLVEKDITYFLKHPPTNTRKESPFMALPPKRRTLEMAKEFWETEYTQMERSRKSAKRDRKALEEGAVVWKDVVVEILSFEGCLAKEVGNMNQSMLSGRAPSPAESKLGPAEILSRMNSTMKYIEDRLRLAEKKKWRLLEACIGAELEAFKQGKDMLEQTFSEGEAEAEQKEEEEDSPPEELFKEDADQEELGEGLLGNLGTNGSGLQQQSLYDTDDDGPSADLMVSRGGDDTD